jgi:predicted PurR-regulated permease PerM
LAQVVLALLLVSGVVLLLQVVGIVFGPVLISLLLAYVLDNLLDWIASRGVSRTVAALVIAGAVLLGIAAFALIFVPVLVTELSDAFTQLPERALALFEDGQRFLVEQLGLPPEKVREALTALSEKAQTALGDAGKAVAASVASVFNLVLFPVFSIYFLRDWNRLVRLPLEVVPERYRDGVVARARVMDKVVGAWVRGQIKVALILAVLLAVGLSAVGLKLGFAIGFLAGLLNVIPYLGAAIGILLAVVMLVVEQSTVVDYALVAAVFAVVQILEGYVITPRIVGSQVGLSPVMVLIVLLVGGSLFGFVGILLAIPATAAGSVLVKDGLEIYRRSDFWRGRHAEGALGEQLRAEPAADPPPPSPPLLHGDGDATEADATEAE